MKHILMLLVIGLSWANAFAQTDQRRLYLYQPAAIALQTKTTVDAPLVLDEARKTDLSFPGKEFVEKIILGESLALPPEWHYALQQGDMLIFIGEGAITSVIDSETTSKKALAFRYDGENLIFDYFFISKEAPGNRIAYPFDNSNYIVALR